MNAGANDGLLRKLQLLIVSLIHKVSPTMMTCREFDAFIVDYLDEKLPPRRRAIFENHMRRCPSCYDYLANYEKTIKIGKSVFPALDDTVPADVPDDLVAAVLAARRSTSGDAR